MMPMKGTRGTSMPGAKSATRRARSKRITFGYGFSCTSGSTPVPLLLLFTP